MTTSNRINRRFFTVAMTGAAFAGSARALQSPAAAAPPQAAASAAPELPPFTVRDARTMGIGAVKLVKNVEKVDLDFSPASLVKVDELVLKMADEGTTAADAAQVLLVLGCYVGEVVVRSTRGLWEDPGPDERKAGISLPGIRMGSGTWFDPIAQVLKLLENGSRDSVAFWYARVMREDAR